MINLIKNASIPLTRVGAVLIYFTASVYAPRRHWVLRHSVRTSKGLLVRDFTALLALLALLLENRLIGLRLLLTLKLVNRSRRFNIVRLLVDIGRVLSWLVRCRGLFDVEVHLGLRQLNIGAVIDRRLLLTTCWRV